MCKGQSFGSFWVIFCPLTLLTTQNFEKINNAWRYYHFTLVYHKCWSYGVWLLRYQAWQNFLLFWAISLPFDPPNNPKNQNFEKIKKKTPGDIIILHLYTANVDHMMYGSWDIKRGRQNFLSFWAIFCLFTTLTIQKSKILKKWKKSWRYYHFTDEYHESKSYDVWFLR